MFQVRAGGNYQEGEGLCLKVSKDGAQEEKRG